MQKKISREQAATPIAPSFHASSETRALAQILVSDEWSAGDVLSYEDLASQVSMDAADGKFLGRLRSARGISKRDYGICWEPVNGEGVVKLDSEGVVKLLAHDAKRVRRITRRSQARTAQCVKLSELSEDAQVEMVSRMAQLQLVEQATGTSMTQRLEEQARTSPGRTVDARRVLELLG